MSKTYTLTEVAEALEADAKTLRRWIDLENWDLAEKGPQHPNGLGQISKYDKRIFWLTEEQVSLLAKAHSRAWPPRPKTREQAEAQATGVVGAVSLLREQVDTLREDHIGTAQFSNTVKLLEERLQKLEHEYHELFIKHTDLLLAVHELQQAKKPGRKPKQPGEAQAQAED
jgi:hypothetical protein